MTGYDEISKFEGYMLNNGVRQLTVLEPRSNGRGIWSKKTGEIMSRLRFANTACGEICVLFELHREPYNACGELIAFHEVYRIYLTCEYADWLSFEPSEDGKKGVLCGFAREGHKVDIIAYARES